jgi:hypothetical protein
MPIHQRARMELISIVEATRVYAPVPLALDVSVEDSHLVGLFVRRCGDVAGERHATASTPLGHSSLGPLAYRTAESSKQVVC